MTQGYAEEKRTSRTERRHGFYPCLKIKFCGKTHQILNTRNEIIFMEGLNFYGI